MDTVLLQNVVFGLHPPLQRFVTYSMVNTSLKQGLKPVGTVFANDTGMDNSVNKASISLLAMATLVIAAIVAKVRATAAAQAPEGYEDANGFHFGHPNFEK